MKKSLLLLPVMLLAMFSLVNTGCAALLEECEDFDTCGGTAQACCTSTQCHYEYKGKDYDCSGTDCSAAASRLIDDMCDFKKSATIDSEQQLKELTGILLDAARESVQ